MVRLTDFQSGSPNHLTLLIHRAELNVFDDYVWWGGNGVNNGGCYVFGSEHTDFFFSFLQRILFPVKVDVQQGSVDEAGADLADADLSWICRQLGPQGSRERRNGKLGWRIESSHRRNTMPAEAGHIHDGPAFAQLWQGQLTAKRQCPLYDPEGLPLVPGLIEITTEETTGRTEFTFGRHFGNPPGIIVVRTWSNRFFDDMFRPTTVAGVEWIPAGTWDPFQRSTFVSPAFAGYVSGHSAFSRAGAEVLSQLTGSEFFPGGLGTETIPMNTFKAEEGPTEDIELQWATYYDAADQAGISRIYGGIHIPADDGPGRVIGSKVGAAAVAKAMEYFSPSPQPLEIAQYKTADSWTLEWNVESNYVYSVETSDDMSAGSFSPVFEPQTYPATFATFTNDLPLVGQKFYRIRRQPAPVEEPPLAE